MNMDSFDFASEMVFGKTFINQNLIKKNTI